MPKRKPVTDVVKPSVGLLCKLGSIAVHAEEYLSPAGHVFDRTALDQLFQDPEVTAWLDEMGKMALIPVKRKR